MNARRTTVVTVQAFLEAIALRKRSKLRARKLRLHVTHDTTTLKGSETAITMAAIYLKRLL